CYEPTTRRCHSSSCDRLVAIAPNGCDRSGTQPGAITSASPRRAGGDRLPRGCAFPSTGFVRWRRTALEERLQRQGHRVGELHVVGEEIGASIAPGLFHVGLEQQGDADRPSESERTIARECEDLEGECCRRATHLVVRVELGMGEPN